MLLRAWLVSRRKEEPEVGERTIDGKVVPDMLAATALTVPSQSPDGDYVLRGLPDYGKTLLKLNTADFEYVPEPLEELPEPPVEEPVVKRSWFRFPNLKHIFGSFAGKSSVPPVEEPVAKRAPRQVPKRGPRTVPRWVRVTALALVAVAAGAGLVAFGVKQYQKQQIEKENKEAAYKATLDKQKQDAENNRLLADKANQEAEYQRQQAALAKAGALNKQPPPYTGPTSGDLSCPASPVVQNGEVVFRNLPPGRLRLTSYDPKIWVATFLPGEGATQRLVLRNMKPGSQKSCTVHWELER